MAEQISNIPTKVGNAKDPDYDALRDRIHARFALNTAFEPLFTTSATILWDAFIGSFPEEERQFHNCRACRHFIERFGGLVTIDPKGRIKPAIWHSEDADPAYANAFEKMAAIVCSSKITGVFISSEQILGQPQTGDWTHFNVCVPKGSILKKGLKTAFQAMAEKGEDFKNVMRALEDFHAPVLDQALRVLESDALYCSESVLGPAKWLKEVHSAALEGHRANIVWRAIAKAPAGFCHPRSSMIGTLLEDIAAGLSFEDVSKRFAAKMHPLRYQRPQAAPTAGNIAQAEKIIGELGAAGSLARRFARLDEIQSIWKPAPEEAPAEQTGVFDHLKPKEAKPNLDIPARTVTWDKFSRNVLPTAQKIEVKVPDSGDFAALLTAENMDAPPILQWDSEERRNPFSWYLYNNESYASQWGLTPHAWVNVNAITGNPAGWFAENTHHGTYALFILEGARDTNDKSGAAIFPSTLKSEFHSIRGTIEAYSRTAKLGGRSEASANGLIIVGKGSEKKRKIEIRVTGTGYTQKYIIDRWD